MKASEIFAKAADLIEENGHCKNIEHSSEGEYCWIGAIRKIAMGNTFGENGIKDESVLILPDEIYRSISSDEIFYGILWNNSLDTTPKMVIERLRNMADAARKKEEQAA